LFCLLVDQLELLNALKGRSYSFTEWRCGIRNLGRKNTLHTSKRGI